MRDPALYSEGYYHVTNRGVDKRQVFVDDVDYRAFYEYMYLFSDSQYENPHGRPLKKEVELAAYEALWMDRVPLVKILSFVLVGNHFHMFLEQLMEDGISRFIHKLQKTYSRQFNNRHGRCGGLFEKSFKAVPVTSDGHFLHLPRYQHLNSLDLVFPEWREGKVADWDRAWRILETNKWSSHHVYMRRSQPLPLVDLDFATTSFQSSSDYIGYLKEWAGRDANSADLQDILFI